MNIESGGVLDHQQSREMSTTTSTTKIIMMMMTAMIIIIKMLIIIPILLSLSLLLHQGVCTFLEPVQQLPLLPLVLIILSTLQRHPLELNKVPSLVHCKHQISQFHQNGGKVHGVSRGLHLWQPAPGLNNASLASTNVQPSHEPL